MGAFLMALAQKAGQKMMEKKKRGGGGKGAQGGSDSANTGSGTKRSEDAMSQMDQRRRRPARSDSGR